MFRRETRRAKRFCRRKFSVGLPGRELYPVPSCILGCTHMYIYGIIIKASFSECHAITLAYMDYIGVLELLKYRKN